MQAQASPGVKAFIASTMPEVWGVVNGGLVDEGLVDDVSDDSYIQNRRVAHSG